MFNFFFKGLDGLAINVVPVEVMLGNQVEITCTFSILGDEASDMALIHQEQYLVRRSGGDLEEILLSDGSKCKRISYIIRKATLADAGVYKCQATGNDEHQHHWETNYRLQIFCKLHKSRLHYFNLFIL